MAGKKANFLNEFFFSKDQAAKYPALAIDVFGGAMRYDMSTPFCGLLQVGSSKAVVYDQN
jgi:hypothetical protein